MNIKPFLFQYISKFIEHYRVSVNGLIAFSQNLLLQKFNTLIDLIIDNNLLLYSEQIKKGERSKELLHEAAERRKTELKSHLELEIKTIEEAHKRKIAQIESVIENLSDDGKFDTSQAFSSSMIINVVISLVVFIIGGFTDGFLGANGTGTGTIFSTMIGGIKWGGITFLRGTIVSFFSSISAIWERSNNKQKLIREIDVRKALKDKTIKRINQDFSEKIEEFEEQL